MGYGGAFFPRFGVGKCSLLVILPFAVLHLFAADFARAQSVAAPDALVQDAEQKLDQAGDNQKEQGGYLPQGVFDGVVPGEDGGEKLAIRSVRVEGASVFSSKDFSGCITPISGRSVTERQLVVASTCITKIYQDAGYSLSRAVIPPQDLPGGLLIIRVIEGYLSSVRFAGGDVARFGAASFAEVLKHERPLTLALLERQLLLINDIPGLTVADTALAEQGEMTGAFELTITVKTWQLFSSSEADNRGTDAVGPYQSYSSVFLNSLFGRGESIAIGYSSIADSFEELSLGQVSIDVPLDAYGLRLSAYIEASETAPDDLRKLIDTRYKSFETGVNLEYAVKRSRETSLWVGAGIWMRSTNWDTAFGQLVEEELRGVSAYLRLQHRDKFGGENELRLTVRQGLHIGDASRKNDALLSRFDGDGQFTRLNADWVRLHRFDKRWSLRLDAAMQLSSTGLLSSQEFYIGGSRFGRAFDSGVIGGDNAAAASLELRYNLETGRKGLKAMQFYGFVDGGSVFDDGNAFMNGAFVASAGIGTRFYLDWGIDAGVELAFPIEDDHLRGVDDQELFFRIGRRMKLSEIRFDRGIGGLFAGE